MIMEPATHVQYVAGLAEHWQRMGQRDYLTKTLYERARGSVVAVSFVTPPKALVGLVCRNFYTASLRLVQYNVDGSVSVLLDNHSLMQYANCEDDAQKWHVIHLDKVCK
ncbi:hypothetical protein Poli38472_003456 [Pythium oligandrum]|uniref:Uncharacterized protein n=1 Tax=Pythium oligandrum TaxID=41045 RepID=A0A8K1C6J8_PYTOL|nr:hypothetical protein Poli38472_003456 [Pythium oligandrum]|eukprot:TMW57531.1 hypothetical protein Poli38472_003456 [Pythium oligandrum]